MLTRKFPCNSAGMRQWWNRLWRCFTSPYLLDAQGGGLSQSVPQLVGFAMLLLRCWMAITAAV